MPILPKGLNEFYKLYANLHRSFDGILNFTVLNSIYSGNGFQKVRSAFSPPVQQ